MSRRPLLTLSFAVGASLAACSGYDACKTHTDCNTGERCFKGMCAIPEDGLVFGSDLQGSDSRAWPPGDVAIDSGHDISLRDASAPDLNAAHPSTDTRDSAADAGDHCTGERRDGASCDDDCQCTSGRCEGDVCCADGEECCASAMDCDQDLCRHAECHVGNRCEYSAAAYPCGARDSEGNQTCTGDLACNGEGTCLPVRAACGPYAEKRTGVYSCADDMVIAPCHSDCTAENQATHCALGAICVENACVLGQAENGDDCVDDPDCRSGNCSNGICCAEGAICCRTPAACPDECGTAVCTDFTCGMEAYLACGSFDAEGNDLCDGENRCDGQGSCVPFISDCTPYAGDGVFECSLGVGISERCATSCSSPLHCADGYDCDAQGRCVTAGFLPGGEGCDCASGHCQNGFCCDAGECCGDSDNCSGEAVCDPLTRSCEFASDQGAAGDRP